MPKYHVEQNIKILNKDKISNSTLSSHIGALDKKEKSLILILSLSRILLIFIAYFCINFHLFKYCINILFLLIVELWGAPLNFAPKTSAPLNLMPVQVLANQTSKG